MSGNNNNNTSTSDPSLGALYDDEATQTWIIPPSPSITGQAGPASGNVTHSSHATVSSSAAGLSSTSSSSSSSSAFQRRRHQTINAFLKQGETNDSFKVKAPSILTTYWDQQQQPPQPQPSPPSASSQQQNESKQQVESKQRDPLLLPSHPSSTSISAASNTTSLPASRSRLGRLISSFTSRLTRPHTRRRRRNTIANVSEDGSVTSEAEDEGDDDDGRSSDSSDDEDVDERGDQPTTAANDPSVTTGRGASTSISLKPSPSAFPRSKSTFDPSSMVLEDDDAEASNFATVDWGRQDETDFLQYHRMQEPLTMPKLQTGGRGIGGVFLSKLRVLFRILIRVAQRAWRAGQGWVLCALVGFSTGLLASMVDMCVHWVIDFRVGICSDNIWLSNKACCSGTTQTYIPGVRDNTNSLQMSCPEWKDWDQLINNWGVSQGKMDDYITNYIVYVVISGMLGLTSAWLVKSWAKYAAGSGIPEIKTILGGVIIRRVLGGWTLFVKCIALVLSVSSGLQIGKEGPFVHIAACCGAILSKIFKRYRHSQAKTNEILSAACAAGVAVAFGAPIGGILYSLEEVSSFFPQKTMWRAFFCAIVASMTVTYVDPYQQGKLVQFQIDYTNPWQWFEMVPFCLIGIVGGLFGAFFIAVNLRINAARKASFIFNFPLTHVALTAAISSLIKYQSAFTRGNGTGLLEALFSDCSHAPAIDPLDMCNVHFIWNTIGSLIFTTVVSLLLTTYAIGLPVPAGLLIPSLTIGAAMGRLFGTAVRGLQITYPSWGWGICQPADPMCITPGIYALVGGAAVLGGVTRMTVALVVIMFEITGSLIYLLPIMVAVIISKIVGDYFGTDSIYEGAIEALSYPFLDVKREIPSVLKIKDAMTPVSELLVLTIHGHTMSSLYQQLKIITELNINGMPVVTTLEEMLVVGYITRSELKVGLKHAMKHGGTNGTGTVSRSTPCYFAMLDMRYPRTGTYVDLSGLLDPAPVQVSEGMALYRLHEMFSKCGLRIVLVSRFGKLAGILTKKDILHYLHHEHEKHEQKKHRKNKTQQEAHKH